MVAICCTPDEPINEPEEITTPTEEYLRLNFVSGCGYNASTEDSEVSRGAAWRDDDGDGNLILKWESVAIDSEETNSLAFIISDGEKPIYSKATADAESTEGAVSYSGLAVTPHEEDAHHADFQTVNYYTASDLARVKYCYAIAGGAKISENSDNCVHTCHLEMPSTFTQSASQDPSFLRERMYMYATAAYKGENTTLEFKHIPATFRFIVTNSKSEAISLQEVSVSVDEGGSIVAAKSSDLWFDWATGTTDISFSKNGHSKIAVTTNATQLASGEKYTAYAMALPLSNNDAFKGKTLNFSVKFDNQEQVAFQLDAAKLAEINGDGRYNWVSGKSYTIRVSFENDDTVSGEILDGNRIEVTSAISGRYTLIYEKANGQALVNFSSICTLDLDPSASYNDFISENIAPRDAEVIGIYDVHGERQGSIALATLGNDTAQAPIYSFGVLSDVHLGRSAIYPDTDFTTALEFFSAKGAAMTCICGDISQNGKEEEFALYKELISAAALPVYTVTGNHDCTSSGEHIDTALWEQYTGHPLAYEKSVEANGRTDHFLFLGMSRWKFSSTIYLASSIAWLEEKLEEYRNERCFIFTHPFFPDRAGNLNEIYPSGNWLKGKQLTILQKLCDNYPNSVWFSGHSHWEWELQKHQDIANIYTTHSGSQRTSGWCVHIPSYGVPITSDGTTRVDNVHGSQGAVVMVYDNYVEILGTDLKSGKYLPIATYRLDTTPHSVAEKAKHYISAADFMVNQSKTGATVSDVEGMPNYVEVTFTDKGQGFYVANSTYTADATVVRIKIEDIQAFSNGEAIDVPEGVGFYDSEYYLTDIYSTAITHPSSSNSYTGIQFQTSKSKYGDGPLPLTLRMKAQMDFY